jgi:hypothetical protein
MWGIHSALAWRCNARACWRSAVAAAMSSGRIPARARAVARLIGNPRGVNSSIPPRGWPIAAGPGMGRGAAGRGCGSAPRRAQAKERRRAETFDPVTQAVGESAGRPPFGRATRHPPSTATAGGDGVSDAWAPLLLGARSVLKNLRTYCGEWPAPRYPAHRGIHRTTAHKSVPKVARAGDYRPVRKNRSLEPSGRQAR